MILRTFKDPVQKCIACNGSRYYDHNGSPPCGACDGTGKEIEYLDISVMQILMSGTDKSYRIYPEGDYLYLVFGYKQCAPYFIMGEIKESDAENMPIEISAAEFLKLETMKDFIMREPFYLQSLQDILEANYLEMQASCGNL